jgi:hypothetical protein
MKIPITKTELYGMPDYAWNIFIRHIKNRNDENTPIQETAALCFIYYSEIYDYRDWGGAEHLEDKDPETIEEKDWYHGHREFFNYCEENDIGIDNLKQALTTIGATEFVENLLKAAKNRQKSNYYEEDLWLIDNEETLLNAIREYWRSNLEEFYEIVDESYSMRPPKDGVWAGFIIFAIVCVLMIIAALTNPDGPPLEPFIVSICALLATGPALLLYANRWKVSVNGNVITVSILFLRKKCIKFDEISSLRTFNKGTVVYVHGKRLFFINNTIKTYKMFFTQFNLNRRVDGSDHGKPVDEQELYAIRRSNAKKVEGVMWPCFGIGVLLWVFLRQTVPASIYEMLFFSVVMVVTVLYMLHCLRWKMTGFESSIKVRTALRGEREYHFSDIIKVELEKDKLVVFTDGNKPLKIPGGAGCSALVEKLQNENIPVYRNGELL